MIETLLILAQQASGDNLANSLSVIGSILTFIIAVATFSFFLSSTRSMTIENKAKIEANRLAHEVKLEEIRSGFETDMERIRSHHDTEMERLRIQHAETEERTRTLQLEIAGIKAINGNGSHA